MQRHSVTSLETARSLANGPCYAEEEVCILRSRELQRLLSLFFSMDEVCVRSLTVGKFSPLEGKRAPSI